MIKTSSGLLPLKEHLPKDLPFLLKVLSVGKALSIQAHPDSELAVKLHAKDPKNYRDANHKPEMTIALTPFEALCGFSSLAQIVGHLDTVPELSRLVKTEHVNGVREAAKSNDEKVQKQALKAFFAEFISAEKGLVMEQCKAYERRLTTINRPPTALEMLCIRLTGQYPNEVGCFCVFLLNYVTLAPGEAIFLSANEPHAYLLGECVECMALSDNVVRAGLTPKFRDVETLVEMLTYKTCKQEELAMKPTKLSGRSNSVLYQPPVPEFAVIKIALAMEEKENIKTEESDAILLCIRGEGTLISGEEQIKLKVGSILLLNKKSEWTLTCTSTDALLFQAFAQKC
jgi:mannose-6-phosphate isomerase